jgi:hypothetical protein
LSDAWGTDHIINETKDALPDADEAAARPDKLSELVEEW